MRNMIVGRRGWDREGKGCLVTFVKLNRKDERHVIKKEIDWLSKEPRT